MNLDGSDRRPLVVAPEHQWYPSFSPDMTKVLFATTRRRPGAASRSWTWRAARSRTLFDHSAASCDSAPAWSPDGRQIAFESNLDGDLEIFVMNADGTGRPPAHAQHASGTRGRRGRRTARSSRSPAAPTTSTLDIHTMNVDGTDVAPLTTYPGRDESPDWGVNPNPAAVGGTVPATLSLTLGASASFGAFMPGVARDYTRHRRRAPSRARPATRR